MRTLCSKLGLGSQRCEPFAQNWGWTAKNANPLLKSRALTTTRVPPHTPERKEAVFQYFLDTRGHTFGEPAKTRKLDSDLGALENQAG